MSNQPSSGPGLTFMGKFVSLLLVVGLVALGGWIALRRMNNQAGQQVAPNNDVTKSNAAPAGNANVKFDTSDLAETESKPETLAPPATYVPKDNVIDIELSEYAGYSGIIAANGGLEPSDNSYFNTKHGFKVRIKISESESWNELNSGKMAASATTTDVLPLYGRQMQVVVPAQIGYSRGADALMVRSDIRKVNDLKGKIVAAAQFTESDFFIRYLAHEAGIDVNMLDNLNAAPNADAINLIFAKDGLPAGAFFINAINANSPTVAGCTTWAPATTDIPTKTAGKGKLLVSNKNLLIIADILIVNKGFAEKYPEIVAGLVDGLLYGNKAVRDNPESQADVIGKAFKWDHAKTLAELQKVHLSNLPEQLAFFSGGITQGGSFASIYQSSVLAYGNELIPNPVDSDRFLSLDALKKAEASGMYKDQVPVILPLSASNAPSEVDPVLTKDIRFFFIPNSDKLDMSNADNLKGLEAIKRILDVAPGSKVVLLGHVDNARIPELLRTGGQKLVDDTALEAMDLSKRRAKEVMNQVVSHDKADPKRLETVGKGWTQPVSSTQPDLNRRVEVQWFTLE